MEYKVLSISIVRGDAGFGFAPFTKRGDTDIMNEVQKDGIEIEYVAPGGFADISGLQAGDRIVRIGLEDARDMTVMQAAAQIQKCFGSLELIVHRKVTPLSTTEVDGNGPIQEQDILAAAGVSSWSMTDGMVTSRTEPHFEFDASANQCNLLFHTGDTPPSASLDGISTFTVKVGRGLGGFGFAPFPQTIAQAKMHTDECRDMLSACDFCSDGMVIQFVTPGSEAQQKGLRPWDVVTQIGEVSILGMTLQDIVKFIRTEQSLLLYVTRSAVTLPPPVEVKNDLTVEVVIDIPPGSDAGLKFAKGNAVLDKAVTRWGKGFLVTSIDPGSPGQRSGVMVGDLIIDVNGADVRGNSLEQILEMFEKTNVLILKIVRQSPYAGSDTTNSTILVSLMIRSCNGYGFSPHKFSISDAVPLLHRPMPDEVARINPDLLAAYKLDIFAFAIPWGGGLPILSVDPIGPAAMAGLCAGDVVVAVNDADVRPLLGSEVMALMTKSSCLRLQVIRKHQDVATQSDNVFQKQRLSALQMELETERTPIRPIVLFVLTFFTFFTGFLNVYLYRNSPYTIRKWAMASVVVVTTQLIAIIILVAAFLA